MKIIDTFVKMVNYILMRRYCFLICFLFYSYTSSYSQSFTDSNLPIILINTDGGVEIPDSPRILASMEVIFRGEGLRNYLTDQNTAGYLNYNGRISIEIRGSSSQVLQKKQYGFSTLKDDNVSNNNVPLLGMPADNDWILNGLGFEPSFIRDYLNYNLSRMIGEYASRTLYCEVVLNGNYIGLYVLEEKIKQGSDRVNITKIGTLDNTFPKISGGYITKSDKTTGGDPVAWTMSSYIGKNDVTFIHDLPKPENVTFLQNYYIQSEFEKLSSTVSSHNSSLDDGYPSVIDIPSFVDYMIINELGSNADAYQFSTYYHKDRNGKLRAGPIWDLNLTFGYDLSIWGYDRSKTNNWQFSNGDNEGPKYWRDLFNNPEFRCCLSRRWNQLIQPGQPLNYSSIEALIDKTVATISEAVIRDNIRWALDIDFTSEINKIKNFLQLRIPWMTDAIGPASNCSNVILPPLVISKIMYHPDTTRTFPDSDQQEFLEILNTGASTVSLAGVYFSGTGFVYQFPSYSTIGPNSKIVLAGNSDIFIKKYGVSPFGQFTRNLSNKGEKLVLADGFGNVIDSVTYSDSPPWPSADGNGYYLELIDPLSDNSIASNWTASANMLLSVRENENNLVLKVYPIPVKAKLSIESSETINFVELFDFQGRLIRRINIDSGTYQLDMSSYSKGIYMLNIITRDKCFVKKVIKE
jgi:hypothetical protein